MEGMSDRIAGRPFRRADPKFFGTPDEPHLAPEGPEGTELAGASLEPPEPVTTGSLAWGGHANGRIPGDSLVGIGGGHKLEASAAQDWNALVSAAKADGVDIGITDSYRSYDGQVKVRKEKGHLVATATPGTSNHGWGRALDINVNDPKVLRWLQGNAGRFGFVNPEWARRPGKSFEPWHYEYRKHPSQQVPSGGHDHKPARATSRPAPLDFPISRPDDSQRLSMQPGSR
jgi:hypothetical protein